LKLLYVGPEHHLKTKSTEFLINLLNEHFELTVTTGFDFKPENFDVVLFFQSLPPYEVYKRCKKTVLVPMYDAVRTLSLTKWRLYRPSKILCFCRAMHEKLSKLGFDTKYVKYFPQPLPQACEATELSAFFWQRGEQINSELVKKLLPNVKLTLRELKDNKNNWKLNQEDYIKQLKGSNIFIAPRLYEGIGMAFLEAMARGMAVVAPDVPTMNEYIKDGINGYLYDIKNPKPINLENIDKVRQNALTSVQEGYKNWSIEKEFIINYLQTPTRQTVSSADLILKDMFDIKNYKKLLRKMICK